MEENTNVFLGTERVGKLMRGYACLLYTSDAADE